MRRLWRILRGRGPVFTALPTIPCQAYRPITGYYRNWPGVRCNLARGHACDHAHLTPDGIRWVWPRGLERGEVMS